MGGMQDVPGGAAVPAPSGGDERGVGGQQLTSRIGGLSVMKGLILYGASLTFAGFYAYFMEEIASAPTGTPPSFSATMVGAAAALAGVLGSAFALVIGVPTSDSGVNADLRLDQQKAQKNELKRSEKGVFWLRRLLSLEPSDTNRASWPLTFGIWTYALVAGATAIVYFLHSAETPDAIRALAVAFAGYVITLVTAAYGLSTKGA